MVAQGVGEESSPTPSGANFMAAEVKPGSACEVGLPKQILHATGRAHVVAGAVITP